MAPLFEELARDQTPSGLLTLRRRHDPARDADVYEVKLDDEWLMSSRFTVGEVALAQVGLEAVDGDDLVVVVGGLGLGYTAGAVLEDPRVASMLVVEAAPAVIGWHRDGLLPEVPDLGADTRTRLLHGDLFAMVLGGHGLDPDRPGRRFDAILVDIDHTPSHHLDPSHAPFYRPAGLQQLSSHLGPGGVFALWSDDPPDDQFMAVLGGVFGSVDARVVEFRNMATREVDANTIYLAR